MYQELVEALRLVHKEATETLGDENATHTILFNVERSMVSYPTDLGDCRHLHYPDLDSLYTACDEANVTCGHVYLYRDPYDIVRSTHQKRSFNPTILSATKLYYSMLNIIFAQFTAHEHRTLACWGFYDANATAAELWNRVQTLFGWTDAEFATVKQRIHPHPSHPNRTAIVPTELDIYMQSMVRAHDRTLQLCRKQVRQNGWVVEAS